jgi:nicotinate-nucleotide pyrophosphorylase (carboxylating)
MNQLIETITSVSANRDVPAATDPEELSALIQLALEQDIRSGDITSQWTIPPTLSSTARVVAKQSGVFCGATVLAAVFARIDKNILVTPLVPEGSRVSQADVVLVMEGPLRSLLAGERTALNFIQRMSGIATVTAQFCEAVRGTHARVVDTRKTAPAFRALDKYAVRMGGGENHRMGLYDMVLLKDNHVDSVGGVAEAIRRARMGCQAHRSSARIAVEVRNARELDEAIALQPDVILLDNMSAAQVRSELARVRPLNRSEIEVSGNIGLGNVREYAQTGVDRISVGALTHSVIAFDLSMLINIP